MFSYVMVFSASKHFAGCNRIQYYFEFKHARSLEIVTDGSSSQHSQTNELNHIFLTHTVTNKFQLF